MAQCNADLQRRLEAGGVSALPASDRILYEVQIRELEEMLECYMNYKKQSEIDECVENIGFSNSELVSL